MKKYFLLLVMIAFCFESTFSQSGMWTWISGDSTVGALGVYGTQGIPSVNNHPPALYEYAEWKDKQGNFWIYGGWTPPLSDLWKYNPSTNEWTWVKGTGVIQNAVYGTQGVPDPANTPGQREPTAVTWVDTSGNLWLFGSGFNNDIWKYDIAINQWAWMKGTGGMGDHGTQGVPSPSNLPGGRNETCSAWTDSLNNLWLFGGYGYDDTSAVGLLNDVMKYDISTNEWTWMNGSAFADEPANYGIKGVSSQSNDPGARYTHTKWNDKDGNFWIMGGGDFNYRFNDVWKFDLSTNNWTWMAGTNLPNDSGAFLSTCSNDTVNFPGSRMENRSSVTDNCGRFWMYGGEANYDPYENLNDLWVFNPQELTWNWISGDSSYNQAGSYGILGVPSISNIPPARHGAVAWWGNDNKFYMFAGTAYNNSPNFGDLWVYTPDTTCIGSCECTIDDPVILQSGDTLFVAQAYSGYQWYMNNVPINGATNSFYIITANGNYGIVVIDSNGCSAEAVISDVISVFDLLENNSSIIYPNPAEDKLFIRVNWPSLSGEIKVYNVIGEMLLSVHMANEIDVHTLIPGSYLLEVHHGDKFFRSKFLKK